MALSNYMLSNKQLALEYTHILFLEENSHIILHCFVSFLSFGGVRSIYLCLDIYGRMSGYV